MLIRSRTLSTALVSILFTLHMGACSSQEATTEETVQPTEDQAVAEAPTEPSEKDKALAEASSSDFTEPGQVQLNGDVPASIAATEGEAPAAPSADSEIPTSVDGIDNAPAAPVEPAPDLTSETGLSGVNANVSVYFAKSSARVSREYRNQLKDVAEKLKSDRSMKIDLSGHCDNRGSAAFNRRLANKRARAVKNALVRMGVKSSQIVIGPAQLASSGSTEEEHAQNRRVEVQFQ